MNSRSLVYGVAIILVVIAGLVMLYPASETNKQLPLSNPNNINQHNWNPPDSNQIPATEYGDLIKYGRELIVNTAYYLGPKGIVARISNGLNCQNCHINAGTRLYANSFAMVASTYPKFRHRSGRIETISFRVNECMQRSMNGKQLDSISNEMKAITAYLLWIGKDITAANKIPGMETLNIPLLDRAADTVNGKTVYLKKCVVCHGLNGEGLLNHDSSGYSYPPLWGQYSYNVSSGMYRLFRLAPFIKYNMPYSVVENKIQLTDAEAWDVAAFISSKPRPVKFFNYDWKKKNSKPVDYPFGPFDDTFSAMQHKYGPFKEMLRLKDLKNQSSKTDTAALVQQK